MTAAVYVRVRDVSAFRRVVLQAGHQAEVARRVGISRQRLHYLLTGKRTTVRVDVAVALEDTLGVGRGFLFGFACGDLAAPYATDVGAA